MNDTQTPENQVAHKHDQFFRMLMADQRVARDLLQVHLPIEVKKVIDLNNLILQPRSQVDGVRKESIVDVLYKTTIAKREAFIYILVEHQSTPDALMPFRLLKYTVNVMEDHLRKYKKKKLPLVYPMVIYHGKRPYSYSTDIKKLVDAPSELIEQYFLKPFQLIDLGLIKDEDLKQHAWAGVMEFALKNIHASNILTRLRDFSEVMREIGSIGGAEFVAIVLQYMLDCGEFDDMESFLELVYNHISPEIGGQLMTNGERLRAEGKAQGIAQGLSQGLSQGIAQGKAEQAVETARRLIVEGVGLSIIAKTTGLPFEQVINLQETING